MDEENVQELRRMAPKNEHARIRLLMDFAPSAVSRHVPDPYYGGPAGFENVLDLLEEAAEGLLRELVRKKRLAVSPRGIPVGHG